MSQDWWNVQSNSGGNGGHWKEVESEPYRPTPPPPIAPPAVTPQVTVKEKQEKKKPGKVHVAAGIAAAIAVGAILVTSVSDGDERSDPVASSQVGREDLPAAGGDPEGVSVGTSSKSPSKSAQKGPESPSVPAEVAIVASPKGRGDVGAVVNVTLVNNTDEPVTVMATMIKGDGQSAITGEGTLAPGSVKVNPGEEATGTVEFASYDHPAQIALMDFNGTVIATGNVGGK